ISFFFSSRRRHTRFSRDWSSDVCSSDLSRDHPDENVGEVTAIYLRQAHWGRGIGRRLFAAVVDRLREAGFEEAILWVLDTNARARRFYEAAGWEADGSE